MNKSVAMGPARTKNTRTAGTSLFATQILLLNRHESLFYSKLNALILAAAALTSRRRQILSCCLANHMGKQKKLACNIHNQGKDVEVSLSKSPSAQPQRSGQNVVPASAQITVCSTSCMNLPKLRQPIFRTNTNRESQKSLASKSVSEYSEVS